MNSTAVTRTVVLVPTYGRPRMLERCLESLASQTILRSPAHEVVVVVGDNNPDHSGSVQVARRGDAFPCELVAIHVASPGLCANRNALMAAAKERQPDFVALIDDDEWAEPDWLEGLILGMQRFDADAMVGPVETAYHPASPRWIRESGISQTNPALRRLATGAPSPKLASHNTIIKADLLDAVVAPWFPPELSEIGGEDRAFFLRAAARGRGNILWCREALVHEELPLERSDWAYFRARSIQRGIAAVRVPPAVSAREPRASMPSARLETVRQAALLLAAVPLLLTRRGRYRYLRHALYVCGRIKGHFGAADRFYGRSSHQLR